MQIKDLIFFGFAAIAFAQNDCDSSDGSNDSDCTTTVNGIVVTNLMTTTDFGVSTTLVPVLTQSVDTTSDVGVNTDRSTLTETTDFGTVATNTQYAVTSNVNLQSGYAYATNSAGMTIATYTGTDMNQPSTQAVQTVITTSVVPTSTGGAAAAMVTAGPMIGAAAMGALAFLI